MKNKATAILVLIVILLIERGQAEMTLYGDHNITGYLRGGGAYYASPYSIAYGYNAQALGNASQAFGWNSSTDWNAYYAFASGLNAKGYGVLSVTFGLYTRSMSYGELTFGQYNAVPSSATVATWVSTEPLLTLGNGTSDTNRSNAFEILKNGNMTGYGADNRLPSQTTLPDNASILTRSLGDARYLTPATAAATYLTPATAAATYLTPATAASTYLTPATAASTYLTPAAAASTYLTPAAAASTYLTVDNAASAYLTSGSAASTYLTTATAASTYLTPAAGNAEYIRKDSTALSVGPGSVVTGGNSFALGTGTSAQGFAQFVVGRYNVLQGDAGNWVATDDLFTVGNGSTTTSRSNALVVKKNGDTIVSGKTRATGGMVIPGVPDPQAADPATATIVATHLLLIPQQGDLSMGSFTAGAKPQ